MARVGAKPMAQNTHRTELILMFETLVYFLSQILKKIACARIRTGYLSICYIILRVYHEKILTRISIFRN